MENKDLDALYDIIKNIVTREEFDAALGDCPSRNFVPFISQHGRHSGDVYTRMFPIDQPKKY